VLEAANLINYFGRQRVLDDIVVEPLLFRKGGTNLALYGLGNMRDTRLVAAFKAGKVKFLRPVDKGSWVNVLLLHQNRPANRGVKASIPDHFIPDMFVRGRRRRRRRPGACSAAEPEPLHAPGGRPRPELQAAC